MYISVFIQFVHQGPSILVLHLHPLVQLIQTDPEVQNCHLYQTLPL